MTLDGARVVMGELCTQSKELYLSSCQELGRLATLAYPLEVHSKMHQSDTTGIYFNCSKQGQQVQHIRGGTPEPTDRAENLSLIPPLQGTPLIK